jgi:hypothetical protein
MQWEFKSNNTKTEFKSIIDQMVGLGYKPINLNVVTYSSDPRFSSIWQKGNGNNDWACYHGMDQKSFRKKIKDFKKAGLLPVDIAVWKENGKVIFGAIWHNMISEGEIELEVHENKLSKMITDYAEKGYSIKDINGYVVNSETFYACIFSKESAGSQIISYGLTTTDLQNVMNERVNLGYYPKELNYFNNRGNIYCTGIWEKTNQSWENKRSLSVEDFQNYLNNKTDDGYIPIDIDQYYYEQNFYYGATLTKVIRNEIVVAPHYKQSNVTTSSSANANELKISPVEQQTKVWCWLATGEMIFKYFNIPNLNPGGNYQCGIIGSIFYNTPCNNNCFNSNCIIGSGSNANTVRMLKDYAWLSSKKVFSCQEAYELNFSTIKFNIDKKKPILCGISPSRKQYYSGAEHVVVLIGYRTIHDTTYVIINDPFPYPNYDNPYLKANATIIQKNQYLIGLQTFTNNMFWHWSLSDINIQ